MKKETREDLLVANTKLFAENKEWQDGDITRRKALSKMFGIEILRNPYRETSEFVTLTWPEIYYHIGKLQAARTFLNFDGNISELEVKVEQMDRNWKKYFEDK